MHSRFLQESFGTGLVVSPVRLSLLGDAMNDAMCLVDIARHFSVLDDLAPVKVTFEDGRVVAEAMNGKCDRQSLKAAQLSSCYEGIATVICSGQFDFAVPSSLHTVGIPDPLLLRQFADLHHGVTPQVTRYHGACDDYGLQVEFRDSNGDTSFAMLASGNFTNQMENVPPMPRRTPDVCVYPSANVVKLMKTLANEAKQKCVERFWPIMNKRGRLFFSFDFEVSNDSPVCFEVASGLPYCQLRPYSYDAAAVLKVLALSNAAQPVAMSFLNSGVLILEVVSALGGHYKFVFIGEGELISDAELALDLVKHLVSGNAEDACMYGDWEPDL